MKIGRNEKCWCGSDKKFKHCHYGRDQNTPISKGEAIGQSKKIGTRKCCYVPNEMKHECSKKIINAHTVSKSGSLQEIADESNHVLGLKIDLPNLFKNKGKLTPEKIGVNQASTFKGFCSTHDKRLFSCIEDRQFSGTEEQCFALMYRSIAKELHAKEGSLLSSKQLLRNGDKGKPLLDQMSIQSIAADNELGLQTAISELLEFKTQLDNQLLGKVTNSMSHLIIESLAPMPVAVSSMCAPICDFKCKMVQDLGDLNVAAESVVFNSFSSDGKGYVVFSWLKESNIILGFIDSLLALGKDDIFSSLVRFFFGVAENTFISPTWWNGLEIRQRNKIESQIMSGVNPFEFQPTKLLVNDGINFSGWNIEKITQINF